MTFLFDGPALADVRIVLAHGAGAGQDSVILTALAARWAASGIAVMRFNFAYMDHIQRTGRRRPPPPVASLADEYMAAVHHADVLHGPAQIMLFAGKSMGARVAAAAAVTACPAGFAALGYPFHPAGRPAVRRDGALRALPCPGLVVQGSRDRLGLPGEVESYGLPGSVSLHWVAGADHDMKPRRRDGRTHDECLDEAAQAVVRFAGGLRHRYA
ncbi:MAG: alpha/beta hydrolase [Alphaproteobacteria bacterium]